MTPASSVRWMLAFTVTSLALADGVLHVALDFVLFNGSLWGSAMPGPPPGPPASGGPAPAGPPPAANKLLQALDISHITGLPLNELFLLNAIGYVVLILAFLSARRWLGRWRWLVDVVLIGYTAASIVGWLDIGRPNPHGLGYLSKAIEVVLIAALAAHAWMVLRARGAGDRVA